MACPYHEICDDHLCYSATHSHTYISHLSLIIRYFPPGNAYFFCFFYDSGIRALLMPHKTNRHPHAVKFISGRHIFLCEIHNIYKRTCNQIYVYMLMFPPSSLMLAYLGYKNMGVLRPARYASKQIRDIGVRMMFLTSYPPNALPCRPFVN